MAENVNIWNMQECNLAAFIRVQGPLVKNLNTVSSSTVYNHITNPHTIIKQARSLIIGEKLATKSAFWKAGIFRQWPKSSFFIDGESNCSCAVESEGYWACDFVVDLYKKVTLLPFQSRCTYNNSWIDQIAAIGRKGGFFKIWKDTFKTMLLTYTLFLRIRNNYVCTVHCSEYEDYCVHATALTRDSLDRN